MTPWLSPTTGGQLHVSTRRAGCIKWRHVIAGYNVSWLGLASHEVIVATAEAHSQMRWRIVGLSLDGGEVFTLELDERPTSPTLVADGGVCVGVGGSIVKVSPEGQVEWQTEVGDRVESLSPVDTLGRLYAVTASADALGTDKNADGSAGWSMRSKQAMTLCCVDSGGHVLERSKVFGNHTGISGVVVSPKGMIYVGTLDGVLYAFDAGPQ